jgi:hypothetical protein
MLSMLKKAMLLFLILCMLIIMVSCGGNPIIPPVDEEGNIQITDMFWNSDMKVIEIILDPFPSTWGNWTMYIDGEKLSMEGGPGNPVIRPNASLDELPTGLLVGTLPWVSPLTEVDFPCCETIQFNIPGEGLTNEYEFNLINFGCETASEEECSQTPTIEDNVDQEYVIEEKYFQVNADLGGTFSLDDGTEVKIDPGDLSDDAYLVLKKVNYDLELSKSWWNPHNIYIYIVDILDVKDLLGPVDLYMVSNQVEYSAGAIIRVVDGTFELVKEFTNAEGGKVQVAIEEIGKAAYMFVTDPINGLLILNDSVTDINSAVQYYYDENCTSLFSLYQQALQKEEIAGDDLENYPGVTREDAEEIFAEVDSWKTIIDLSADLITKLAPNPVTAAYSIYSAFMGLGEICQYYNAYMVAENKTNIYKSKIFKRRVIKYLYEQGCIGENHPPVISNLSADPPSVDIDQTTTITCFASDPDGDPLTYHWTKNGGAFVGSTSGLSVTWRAPSTEGNYTVECEVSDGKGGEDSESINIIVTESEEPGGIYDLRDIGPAGGYIFYDKGYYSNGWRYLETAPASTEWTGKQWGSYGTLIGGTERGIGTGQSNTTKIVTWLNSHSETDKAAQLCDALIYGGYSDWFLPSKDELNLIYENLYLFGVGGFADAFYWSSSEYNAWCAWSQNFYSGLQYNSISEYYTDRRVRAVRAF